jgi:hypothetical protein
VSAGPEVLRNGGSARLRAARIAAREGDRQNLYAFAEARVFDDRVDAQGEEGVNVLAIGVHYGFSCKPFHR